MLLASDAVVQDLASNIAMAARAITDDAGTPVMLPTIDPKVLRTAALLALQMCAGDVVLDGGKRYFLAPPRPSPSAVQIANGV